MKMLIWSLDLVEWWHSYGGKAVELQRFAKRVVGFVLRLQVASAVGAHLSL